ncbi:MAG: glutamyl-tRNA reductase [Cellulomonas sp.]|nr:glutamyl-tRNA reductase [Cellulomonas sp.]
MVLLALTADHHDLDLGTLELLSSQVTGLGAELVASGAALGAVTLATCNRVELYLDTATPEAARADGLAGLERRAGPRATAGLRLWTDRPAIEHLFAVTAGLESMVVGEREIVGQVRTALADAHAARLTTPLLEAAFQNASRVSRDVEARTGLGAAGRSMVAVALDIAGADLAADWSALRTLLVGTGSYAGASLAALRERGVRDVQVHSGSGRAHAFAERHGARPAPDLVAALAEVHLVVACSGVGGVPLSARRLSEARAGSGRPLVVVDLALAHDVEPAVADLPGVRLVTMRDVAAHAPDAGEPARAARADVAAAAARFETDRRVRAWDVRIVAARAQVLAALPDDPDGLAAARRRAHTQMHGPTARARAAARVGDETAYEEALAELSALVTAAFS